MLDQDFDNGFTVKVCSLHGNNCTMCFDQINKYMIEWCLMSKMNLASWKWCWSSLTLPGTELYYGKRVQQGAALSCWNDPLNEKNVWFCLSPSVHLRLLLCTSQGLASFFTVANVLTQNPTSYAWNRSCSAQVHIGYPASPHPFFPLHMPLATVLVQSNAAISFSSHSKTLPAAHFYF